MSRGLVRDSLTIFVDGDEVPGLIAYGLRTPRTGPLPEFPSSAWIAKPEPTPFALHGDTWEVLMWEVPIIIWPTGPTFQEAVRGTLEALIGSGCRVAWIGAEGLPFCDPPGLFDPECMSGGVLAWITDNGKFQCPLDPDDVLAPVTDDELLVLREHARGLADASGGRA